MKSYCFLGDQALRFRIVVASLLVANCVGARSMAQSDAPPWRKAPTALRIQVDSREGRAWVLNQDAVYLYDIAPRKLVKRIDLPRWIVVSEDFSCPPDLTLTPSGGVLVTSNVVPTIWEIDSESLVVRIHPLSLDVDNEKEVGFTGLAYGRSGKDLFGISAMHGSVWRIDLARNRAYKMPLSRQVADACGSGFFPKSAFGHTPGMREMVGIR